jgi:hypothetical protein
MNDETGEMAPRGWIASMLMAYVQPFPTWIAA